MLPPSDENDPNNPFARPSPWGRLPPTTFAVGPLPKAAAPPRPQPAPSPAPAPARQPGVITRPTPTLGRPTGILSGSAVPTGRGNILAGSAVPTGRGSVLTGSVLPSPAPTPAPAAARPADPPPVAPPVAAPAAAPAAAPVTAKAAPQDPVLQDLFEPELLQTGANVSETTPAPVRPRVPDPSSEPAAPTFTPLGVPPRHAPAARRRVGYDAALQPGRDRPAARRSPVRTPMIAGAALAAFAGCAVGIVLLNRNGAVPADVTTPATVAAAPPLAAGRLSMATTPLPSELQAPATPAAAPVAETPIAAPPQRVAAATPRSAPLRRRIAAEPPATIEVPPAATAAPVLAVATPAPVAVPPPTPAPRAAPPPADPDAPMATITPDAN